MLKKLTEIFRAFEGRLAEYANEPHVWYLDWALRYLPITRQLMRDVMPCSNVLEIGCNNFGLRCFMAHRVVCVDLKFDRSILGHFQTARVIGSVLWLPLTSASSDFIVCVDTFEHLSSEDRQQAVIEILRVLKLGGKAFIAFPCGGAAESFDRSLWLSMRARGIRVDWLEEHVQNKFPEADEFVQALEKASFSLHFKFELFQYKMNSMMLQGMYVPILLKARNHGTNLCARALLKAGLPLLNRFNWGPCYRRLFVVKKIESGA